MLIYTLAWLAPLGGLFFLRSWLYDVCLLHEQFSFHGFQTFIDETAYRISTVSLNGKYQVNLHDRSAD